MLYDITLIDTPTIPAEASIERLHSITVSGTVMIRDEGRCYQPKWCTACGLCLELEYDKRRDDGFPW